MNPFQLPHRAHGEFSPIENAGAFKADTVKILYAVRMLRPLIKMGIVNFIPNPGGFDSGLEASLLKQAEGRIGDGPVPEEILTRMTRVHGSIFSEFSIRYRRAIELPRSAE